MRDNLWLAEGMGIEPGAAVTASPWVVTAFNDTSRGTPSKAKRTARMKIRVSFFRVLAAIDKIWLLLSSLRVDPKGYPPAYAYLKTFLEILLDRLFRDILNRI